MSIRPFITGIDHDKSAKSLTCDVSSDRSGFHGQDCNISYRSPEADSSCFLTADPTEKRLALSEYAEELARSAWEWSTRDCIMVVSGWLKRLHNVDPALPFRGSYHSPDEARALIKGLGEFDALVAQTLDGLPLERTEEPEIGDIGLIEAPLHWRNVVPIVGGMVAIRWWDDCWMVTARRGIYVNREFGPITIWRT